MEQIIEIDIENSDALLEKYNKKVISNDLIEYLIKKVFEYKEDLTLKIIFNSKVQQDIKKLLKDGLEAEYQRTLKEYYRNSIRQGIYLLIGLFMLILSRIFKSMSLFDELLVIGGWVLIWETIEIEMFSDTLNRKRRKILKKLLKSQIIVQKN